MRTTRHSLLLSSLAFAALLPGGVAAAGTQLSAYGCFTPQHDYPGDYRPLGFGIANYSAGIGARARELFCPVPRTSSLSTITTAWVNYFDNNNGLWAYDNVMVKACSSNYAQNMQSCTNPQVLGQGIQTFTGPSDEELSSSLLSVLNLHPYRFLIVSLPAATAQLGQSALNGYEIF